MTPWRWGIDPSTIRVSVGAWSGDEWMARSVGVQSTRQSRYALIFRRVLALAQELAWECPPDEIWIEQPSGAFTNPTSGYVVGAIAAALGVARPLTPVFMVPPSTWKLHAIGKGNAGKPDIMAWARSIGYEGEVQDEADALGVAKAALLVPRTTKTVVPLAG